MKRLMTALAISALLLAGSATYADTPHDWNGGHFGNNWNQPDNWDNDHKPETEDAITITDSSSGAVSIFNSSANASPYGTFIVGNNTTAMTFQVDKSDITFTSTIVEGDWILTSTNSKDMTAGPMTLGTVEADLSVITTVDSGRTLTASSLEIDADTAGYDRAFTKAGAGSLIVTSYTKLWGDVGVANPATFTLSAGTFDPAALYLYGGDDTDTEAIFYLDDGTLTKPDSTIVQGYVEMRIDAGETANFGDTRCDLDATLEVVDNTTGTCQTDEFRVEHASDTEITVYRTGAGELDASSIVIKGSASYPATLIVSAGSIVTR